MASMGNIMESRQARGRGPAAILAIGTANPPNIFYQSDYPDFYFRATKSEHLTHLKDKFKRMFAGKERETQFSNQFRDIATIVMQKTVNSETQRPYTISMIERLMHEIHFAVDPNSSSKKQALEVIRELQKHFPIKRSPMRVGLTVPEQNISSLMEKLDAWNASIVSKENSGSQLSLICEMEPGHFRDCDNRLRNLQGRLEILAVSVHAEGDTSVDRYDDHEDVDRQTSGL